MAEDDNSTALAAVDSSSSPYTAEEMTARVARKRYEGLSIVRTKANKGKGAWYWAHLEPILLHSHDTGMAKAVKLRCSLCDAQFSASNPSRTASEHLKRGTCPNFAAIPQPISSFPSSPTNPSPPPPPPPPLPPSAHYSNHRKRNSTIASGGSSSYNVSPLTMIDPSRFSREFGCYQATTSNAIVSTNIPPSFHYFHHCQHPQQQHLLLSGGKEDLGALAMLEDSVKKLKSPRTSPGPSLGKTQVDSAFNFLAEWVYECCGAVSFTSLEHPRFRDFLQQVGLPAVSGREMAATRLDVRYEEARAVAEERIKDALFFQLSSHGWRTMCCNSLEESYCIPFNLVNMTVNLPNGTSVFRRAVFTSGVVLTEYAEEVLWDIITDICRGDSTQNQHQQCVGIVGDGCVGGTLTRLESRHQWMVNLTCQLHGIRGLIKHFSKELPLVKNVYHNCIRLVSLVNHRYPVRKSLDALQLQEYGEVRLLTDHHHHHHHHSCSLIHTTVEDILASSAALQLLPQEDQFKKAAEVEEEEEEKFKEVGEMIKDQNFWKEVRAVSSLIKLLKEMSHEVEMERPLVGQCLLIWKEVRRRVKEWCEEFEVEEGEVEKVVEKRFAKNYHPAWAAAYVLDPLHLVKDSSGKYLPPFKYLIPEQERDVDRLVTRLVSREEAHIVLMELMKWRTEGLDPVYAQAVQMMERDPNTGKMKVANPRSGRLVWETHLTDFKVLGRVAARLIFMQATACGFRCNLSLLRWAGWRGRSSKISVEKAQKIMFLAAQSRLEKRDFFTEEEKDAELLGYEDGGDGEENDDVISDVFVDPCM